MKLIASVLLLFTAGMFIGCTTETLEDSVFTFDADGNTVLKPPPAGEGMQVQIGPFDVPVGTEVQRDFYIQLPNDEDYYIDKIEIAMNDGTHHMNFFRTTLDLPDSLPTRKLGEVIYINNGQKEIKQIEYNDSSFYATSIFNESDILIEAQLSGQLFTWDLPKTPEDSQTVIHLRPREKMILQVHYVNAVTQTTKNHKGKVTVNIWKTKAPQNMLAKSSMMFARNRTIDIPPHSEVSFSKDCKFLPIPRPMYILGMTGHFHGRGKRFVVDKMGYDANLNPIVLEEKIYESTNWSEPPFTPYSNPVKLGMNEYIRYTCEYVNTTDKRFKFGPKVEDNEHANLFVWFVPSWQDGRTWYDDSQ